jgi:hypothetical protein
MRSRFLVAAISASTYLAGLNGEIWLGCSAHAAERAELRAAVGGVKTTQVQETTLTNLTSRDLQYLSSPFLRAVNFRNLPRLSRTMAVSGANGINAAWEAGNSSKWYIESQRTGGELIISGLIAHDQQAIQNGLKMFEWALNHQESNGSFKGTGDTFHSTALFVEAAAHSLLLLQSSDSAKRYATQIGRYRTMVRKAAQWMIQPTVWSQGLAHNRPFTHRYYLVASALGLSHLLTHDPQLLEPAHLALRQGLALQRRDGVNPERHGYDSSYQMLGLVYAQRWLVYFPQDPLNPQISAMLHRGMSWMRTRISAAGEIETAGNTRTGGQERRRSGKVKVVDFLTTVRGLAYWSNLTQDSRWESLAKLIVRH